MDHMGIVWRILQADIDADTVRVRKYGTRHHAEFRLSEWDLCPLFLQTHDGQKFMWWDRW